MKKCRICNIEYSIEIFSKQANSSDGLRSYCKICANNIEKERIKKKREDPDWVKKERKRGRTKYYRLYIGTKPSKEMKKKCIDNYKNKYPEKIRAISLSTQIKAQIQGNQLHHWSYREGDEKDIIGLPIRDHRKAHRYMIYDQEQMLYRTIEGVLLDTRENHEKYIKWVIENKE